MRPLKITKNRLDAKNPVLPYIKAENDIYKIVIYDVDGIITTVCSLKRPRGYNLQYVAPDAIIIDTEGDMNYIMSDTDIDDKIQNINTTRQARYELISIMEQYFDIIINP